MTLPLCRVAVRPFLVLVFVATLVIGIGAPALASQARIWTDIQGRTIEAAFIRVDGDAVMLSMDGNPVRVPIARLSEADKQWLDQQVSGGGSAVGITKQESANEPFDNSQVLDRIQLETKRVWTDDRNNQITAEFVRVHNRNVVLSQFGRIQTLPFDRFSADDQDYIKRLLRSRGEDDLASALDRTPPRLQIATVYNPQQHSPPESSFSTPRPTPPPTPVMPTAPMQTVNNQLNDMRARQEEARRKMLEEMERQRQESNERLRQMEEERRQREAERLDERERQLAQSAQYSRTSPSTSTSSSTAYSEYASSTYPTSSSPTFPESVTDSYSSPTNFWEEVNVCSNCNREVSDQFGAGDRCPHCNVYFEYEEGDDGSRVYASGSSGGNSSFEFSGRSFRGIISLAVFLCSAVAYGVRKLLS